jgi:hypothetical protein
VVGGPHASFPVIVALVDPQLRLTPAGGVRNAQGCDISFRASDGVTPLDYEIVSYPSATGALGAFRASNLGQFVGFVTKNRGGCLFPCDQPGEDWIGMSKSDTDRLSLIMDTQGGPGNLDGATPPVDGRWYYGAVPSNGVDTRRVFPVRHAGRRGGEPDPEPPCQHLELQHRLDAGQHQHAGATGYYRVDTLVAVAIALFVLPRTWALLREALHVLLEGTPREVDIAALRSTMEGVPGVKTVHDLHVWTLTSGVHALSVHAILQEGATHGQVLGDLRSRVTAGFPISHVTVQLEDHCCGEHAHA